MTTPARSPCRLLDKVLLDRLVTEDEGADIADLAQTLCLTVESIEATTAAIWNV